MTRSQCHPEEPFDRHPDPEQSEGEGSQGKLRDEGSKQRSFASLRMTGHISSLILFSTLAVIIFVTFPHYGVTWDEEFHKNYGEFVLNWYLSGFRDASALHYRDLHLYGGFFDLTAALATRILPFGIYESRHLVNALFGLLAFFAAWKIATRISGPAAGFFAVLFLALTPRFYGHIFNNPKDIPFAAMFSLALYAILRTYDRLPRLRKSDIFLLGILIGLAMGIRVGGIILFGYLTLLWGWKMFPSPSPLPAGERISAERRIRLLYGGKVRGPQLLLSALGIFIIAYLTMLAFWPWAQTNPILNPIQALQSSLQFEWPYTVFFEGDYLKAGELPRSYLPMWFLMTTPEFYWMILVITILSFPRKRESKTMDPRLRGDDKKWQLGFLLFSISLPLLSAIFFKPHLYDGLRHFLFIFPTLAALAGIAFAAFLKSNCGPRPTILLTLLIGLSAGKTLVDMIQLHPYEAVYFNPILSGGLKAASARFDTDYWGSSYKEGAEWLIKNYKPDSARPIRVANCSMDFLTGYYFEKAGSAGKRFQMVGMKENPDIFLSTTRWGCHTSQEGKTLHRVERQQASLLYVIEVAKQG